MGTYDALVVQGDVNTTHNFIQKLFYIKLALRVQMTVFILQQNQVDQLCYVSHMKFS